MAAMVARPPHLGQRPSQRSSSSSTTTTTTTTTTTLKVKTTKAIAVAVGPPTGQTPTSTVPNKHLQALSPGFPPPQVPDTPPASPTKTRRGSVHHVCSPLYPPDRYDRIAESPPVYAIEADDLASAIEHGASQPLPEAKEVFPWLHGLHPANHPQLAFFGARRRSSRKAPKGLRGVTIVKAGGDLSRARLKGALAPTELLPDTNGSEAAFIDPDPPEGFSVRNFHIQACKMATVSDIILYRDDGVSDDELMRLATRFANAQRIRRAQESPADRGPPLFNTFVLSTPFRTVEADHPELVAINSAGQVTGKVLDFFQRERFEMGEMSRASEIAHNVWLGPTPDDSVDRDGARVADEPLYDVLLEATDLAQLSDPLPLEHTPGVLGAANGPHLGEFPSSGSIVPTDWTEADTDKLINNCRWLYELANPERRRSIEQDLDRDGDVCMAVDAVPPPPPPPAKKILIHCADGYTETSFLALAYFMYAEGVPVHEAWLRLHLEKQRNFFAYPSDVSVLLHVQARLLEASPALSSSGLSSSSKSHSRSRSGSRSHSRSGSGSQSHSRSESESRLDEEHAGPPPPPRWLSIMDGSFPSRILPYLYLGNLGHANNPGLLRALGIGQVLSVGESLSWSRVEGDDWAGDTMLVDRVQDNGLDPLTDEFGRCLDFIANGKAKGTATLVHCRVGVSRSATICIAEVMKSLGLSFPRAYCFVRARRLNVIIQPHLRFSYELLKWEETRARESGGHGHGQGGGGGGGRRELEWATIAREIALLNKPYSR